MHFTTVTVALFAASTIATPAIARREAAPVAKPQYGDYGNYGSYGNYGGGGGGGEAPPPAPAPEGSEAPPPEKRWYGGGGNWGPASALLALSI